MPTYEYIREDGSRFDWLQKMSDAPLTECPQTGQKVRRAIHGGSGVIYKGTGFYNTDYKAKPAASPKSSDASGSTGDKAEPAAAPKSDSAPAKTD